MKKYTWMQKTQYQAKQQKANKWLSMTEKTSKTKYAYSSAQKDIKSMGGTNRFLPFDAVGQMFQKAWNTIENFRSKFTASPRRSRQVGQKVANTLNKKFPTLGFTPDNIDSFFSSNLWEELRKSYASDTILKGIGKMKQDEASIKKQLEQNNKYNMSSVYRNVSVREFVEDMVNKYGYSSVNELYEGYGFTR